MTINTILYFVCYLENLNNKTRLMRYFQNVALKISHHILAHSSISRKCNIFCSSISIACTMHTGVLCTAKLLLKYFTQINTRNANMFCKNFAACVGILISVPFCYFRRVFCCSGLTVWPGRRLRAATGNPRRGEDHLDTLRSSCTSSSIIQKLWAENMEV